MGFWDTLIINPLINGFIVLEQALFGNFGLSIIVFTVLVRTATLPLTLRQLRSSRRMQELTPQIQELQKKYKDPKRRQEETMKLYKEAGVNPIGCLGPMIIQFPIWIALYRVLTLTVGGTPERTADLAQRLYPWSFIQQAVPLPTGFLWLDLGRADTTFVMLGLVFITTWLQTKLSLSQASATPQSATQQQTNTMMLWMMPAMFAYFTLNVPSGLALYWTVTNIIGVVMNWFVYGWHKRSRSEILTSLRTTTPAPAAKPAKPAAALTNGSTPAADPATGPRNAGAQRGGRRKRMTDGQPGDNRQDGGGSARQGSQTTRPRSVSSRRRGR